MSNDDERDYAEEAYNQRLLTEVDEVDELCASAWHYSPVGPTEACPVCGEVA